MPYTVWSRGRLIGETDLDFIAPIDVQRSGHFHPNAEGERLMELIASPLPDALELELRRDDGSVVPTKDIGFQDTHRLRALGEALREETEGAEDERTWWENASLEQSEADRQLDMDVQHDLELLDLPPDDWSDEPTPPWVLDDLFDETRFPRYQIHVTLVEGNSIPCGRRLSGG